MLSYLRLKCWTSQPPPPTLILFTFSTNSYTNIYSISELGDTPKF